MTPKKVNTVGKVAVITIGILLVWASEAFF